MAKVTSVDLRNQAQKLLDEAKRIEEIECVKIGKIVLEFYKSNKINDSELKNAIDKFYAIKQRKSKVNNVIG